jgi:hypothetical protein
VPKHSTPPSLRDLALDHIGAIAAELRKQDPTLTREGAVSKAATTREGREAYAIYRSVGSELPWPQAIQKFEEVAKSAGRLRTTRKVSPPRNDPADAIYARMRAEAMAAYPRATESAAIANYLSTPAGQKLHAAWNAAQRTTDE